MLITEFACKFFSCKLLNFSHICQYHCCLEKESYGKSKITGNFQTQITVCITQVSLLLTERFIYLAPTPANSEILKLQ